MRGWCPEGDGEADPEKGKCGLAGNTKIAEEATWQQEALEGVKEFGNSKKYFESSIPDVPISESGTHLSQIGPDLDIADHT